MHRKVLQVLLDVLERDLRERGAKEFTLEDFRSAFDRTQAAIENRGSIHALAMLSWCMVQNLEGGVLRRKQVQWKSREKWLQVFQDVSREEFLCACDVPSELKLQKEFPELLRFIDWMWPKNDESPGEPPKFRQVLSELEEWGMRCYQ